MCIEKYVFQKVEVPLTLTRTRTLNPNRNSNQTLTNLKNLKIVLKKTMWAGGAQERDNKCNLLLLR